MTITLIITAHLFLHYTLSHNDVPLYKVWLWKVEMFSGQSQDSWTAGHGDCSIVGRRGWGGDNARSESHVNLFRNMTSHGYFYRWKKVNSEAIGFTKITSVCCPFPKRKLAHILFLTFIHFKPTNKGLCFLTFYCLIYIIKKKKCTQRHTGCLGAYC